MRRPARARWGCVALNAAEPWAPEPSALLAIPSIPESALTPEGAAALPLEEAPSAPWPCRCDAVMWLSRPTFLARAALPPGLSDRRVAGVLGALVRYRETPVGPYEEVFAALILAGRTGVAAHVPFMAVNLAASVAGGRLNWALPKVLAAFEGGPGSARSGPDTGGPDRGGIWRARSRDGARWRVGAVARPLGPALPARSSGLLLQPWPGGGVRGALIRARGRVRPALVAVEASGSESFAALMAPGRHLGAVLLDGSFILGPPR